MYDYFRHIRRFLLICGLLVFLEMLVAPVLPSVIPETWYFRNYLSLKEIRQTHDFFNDYFDIEPDEHRGWRNRANAAYLKVRHDRFGSRSNTEFVPGQRKKWRVAFVGDSRIHGSSFYIENNQTISACLENKEIETLNLATSGYTLDQVYLATEEAIGRFQPDVVVMGISPDMSRSLDSHYLPLMSREQISMPLLKSRFVLDNGQLQLQIPPNEMLHDLPDNPELLNYLKNMMPGTRNSKNFRYGNQHPCWHSYPFSKPNLNQKQMSWRNNWV